MDPRYLSQGLAFFASRVANAVLVVAQLALVTRLLGADAAATFFVAWTATWITAVALPFGLPLLLPKLVASARAGGDPLRAAQLRSALRWSAPLTAAGLAAVSVVILPDADAGQLVAAVGAMLVAGTAWATLTVLSALAKGHGDVGLSGALQGLLPPLGALLGVAAGALLPGGWTALLWSSAAGMVLAAAVGWRVLVGRIGAAPVRLVLLGRWPGGVDRDTVPSGLLTGVGELVGWLPLWIASALRVGGVQTGALYAALRVATLFSWGFVALVAVVTPQLAAALARRDHGHLRALMWWSAAAGLVVTAPLAVVGVAAARPILTGVDPAYGAFAATLAILVVARLVDAATGPLAEVLVLGDRAWWEVGNQVAGLVLVTAVGVLLEPRVGVEGFAWGFGAAFVVENVLRLVQVRRLFAGPWDDGVVRPARSRPARQPIAAEGRRLLAAVARARPGRPAPPAGARRLLVATAPGVAGAAGAVAVLAGGVDPGSAATLDGLLWLAAATGLLTLLVGGLLGRRDLLAVVASPLPIAVVTFLVLFVARPLTLMLRPGEATLPLAQAGHDAADLSLTVAIGLLGFGAWSAGYLVANELTRPRHPRRRDPVPLGPRLSGPGIAVALGVGTVLWLALFERQGGVAALSASVASVRAGQSSSSYGFVGVWLVQSTALLVFAEHLVRPRLLTRRALWASVPLALAAGVALQVRGLTVSALVGAGLITLLVGRPGRRRAAAIVVAAVALVPLVGLAGQVRDYSQGTTTSKAFGLALHTPPTAYFTSEVSTFDDLVVVRQLVPGSVPRLHGSSLAAIPTALVPRALYPAKPRALDAAVSALLYPGSPAGVPIAFQGELWWNGGDAVVVLGGLVLGLLMGLVGTLGARASSSVPRLVVHVVLVTSCYSLLTRALATMTGNLALALIGTALALALVRPGRLGARALAAPVRRALRPPPARDLGSAAT